MNILFLKLFNMSISAGWLVLAVLVLRILMKKASRWLHVLLWGLVALRLVMPVSPKSMLSLIPSAETVPMDITMTETPQIQSGITMINGVINPLLSETAAPAVGASVNPMQVITAAAAQLWLLGVIGMLLYTVISYLRLRYRLRTAVRLRENIYQSENAASPFVLGLIKPQIYLPYHLDEQTRSHVIAHEQAHIRRKDHLWKPIGFLLLTVYWFHPLLWLAYAFLCRDIELACDEKVIAALGKEARADYTAALLSCSVDRRMLSACPLAFGEVGVKARVKSVMHYKKPAFRVILLSLLACVVTAVCFLTDPIGEIDAPKEDGGEISEEITVAVSPAVKAPEAAIAWGMEVIEEAVADQNAVGKEFDYRVTGAELTALTRINTGTAGLSSGEDLYRLEYRISFDHPERVPMNGGMQMDGDRLTEFTSVGQPYLLLHWEYAGEETVWTPVCMVNDLTIGEEYSTPEMLEKYGNAYTAAVVELTREIMAFRSDAHTQTEKPYLTITALKELVAAHGDDLSWEHFSAFQSREVGSGLYILYYPIDEICHLLIGGVPTDAPMYIRLRSEADHDKWIELPSGDIDAFLLELPPIICKSAGTKIAPYLHFAWSEVWSEHGWMSGDGLYLADRLPVIADAIPTVTYGTDFTVLFRGDVTLQSVTVYDEQFTALSTNAALPAPDELPPGTYYLGLQISVQGDYIASEDKYEAAGYTCICRITAVQ